MMITPVDKTNIMQAAAIHAISWQASHRAFCAPDFVEKHTPERQLEYLQSKMKNGSKVYMLVDEKPVGIVSVTGSLIEDLYVLPDMQNRGYGTALLQFAISRRYGSLKTIPARRDSITEWAFRKQAEETT